MDLSHTRRARTRSLHARLTPVAISLLAIWAGHARAQTTPSATPPSGTSSAASTTGSAGGDNVLPAVTVTSQADATTEGSGSYAASSATIAGQTAQPLKEIPNSVSVVTRQRMDDQNMTRIQDALLYVTGVEALNYGDGTAYYKSRGNYLGIEFDGVSVVSGLQYQTQFDLAMYDRVEVFRGPEGVMTGAADPTTPGGTVNLVRKRPLDTFHISTETQVDTFGSVRQMVDVTGPLNQDGSLRGRAVIVGSDGLKSVDGVREKTFMAYGALDYDINPRTTLAFSAAYEVDPVSGFDYGIGGTPEGTRLPSSYSQNFSPSWNYSYTSLAEANLNLTHKFENDWKSQTTVFYRHELQSSDYAYSGPGVSANGLASYGDQAQRNTYDWFGADTNVSGPIHLFGQDHTFTIGANYSLLTQTEESGFVSLNGPFDGGTYNVFDPDSVPQVNVPFTFASNIRTEQYGVYAQGRIHLAKPLTLVLGARETFFNEESQNVLPTVSNWTTDTRMNGRFIPSAALVYDIVPWLSAYASYSKVFSPQTATTFSGGALPPATGEQFETGLKGSFLNGRLGATAALFRINTNNVAIDDPNNPTGSIAGGGARNEGFEVEVTGEPLPNWNLYAGYTYLNQDFENQTANYSDGTDPKHLFKLWTTYRLSQGFLNGVTVGGGMLAQSQITRGVEQGGYAIFNAQVGYRFNKHVDASLSLNNIFNREYYVRPPGTFFSEFGDRRNLMLTVRTDF
ncbi:TonB-dependent siderophore receptor [Paraburkholderia sp. BCC1885]|uniref:TonB-dependent siderophore receptor n=1 Tax=Paraburkholderia sp. BCC1885 TaxID=2562669 RepID=UPI0021B44C78|nr:TonB-dependent siderophore receptor [Paraburkholderia sp. BCC1885]